MPPWVVDRGLTDPALVGPSSPDMRTRQSLRLFSVLSIALKNRVLTGTFHEVMASISSSLNVKRARNNVTIDFHALTSCLCGQLSHWTSKWDNEAHLDRHKLPARSSNALLASLVNWNWVSASSHLDCIIPTCWKRAGASHGRNESFCTSHPSHHGYGRMSLRALTSNVEENTLLQESISKQYPSLISTQ